VTLSDDMHRLAERTAATLAAIHAAWMAGDLTEPEATAALAAALLDANQGGQVLAVADYTAERIRLIGEPPTFDFDTELRHWNDLDRLTTAVTTVLANEPADRVPVLKLLARGENYSAVQAQSANIRAADPRARGWIRGLSGDGCQLCQWWARGGRVWPVSHRMQTHTGCDCRQITVYDRAATPLRSRQPA
jgi:hypothetical protein